MSEATPTPPTPPTGPPVRDRLLEVARLLRGARHLSPEIQVELADLLDELATELEAVPPSPQTNHLAETAARLVQDLHEHGDEGPLDVAKHRLEEAAARAETTAPVATGLARQLIDVLADIGI